MNIKEAKQEVKNTITAYLKKDDMGEYAIPIERQRPLLLMGPPGIGKTAIITAAIIAFLVYAFVEPSLVYYPCASVATLWFFLGAGLQSVANNKNLKLNSSVKELVGFREPSEFDD